MAATDTLPPARRPGPAPPDFDIRAEAPRRDVALDLLRGLAMVILVVNHLALGSWLGYVTEPFLSAAEALVIVSGVVSGMVFGRRWLVVGARATTRALLKRSFVLYRASVCVVALVGALTLVPGLQTEALTIAPQTTGPDFYAFDGTLRTALAIVTLEAGPWQFSILGFFIAALALTPALLWLLERGWWPAVLVASWVLFFVGRATGLDVLPAQSEDRFPLLIWQVLFVHGLVVGWQRERLERALARWRRPIVATVLGVAAVAALARLHEIDLDPFIGAADWRRWDEAHFDKPTLDAARLISMVAFTAAAYIGFRRFEPLATRTVGRVLLPLGRASFYVFIVHVFVCLAVASLPLLSDGGMGRTLNTPVLLGCLALIWWLVSRRVLFRVIPR